VVTHDSGRLSLRSFMTSSASPPLVASPSEVRGPADMSASDGTHENLRRDFSEGPDATSPGTFSETKKRRTGTSSRGVANLTPDQLAKKRANDREAQRAIRERTKNQIESLERKIKELTSQQPYQELQHVLRQKELVEAENADMKKRLASIVSLIHPILGQHGQYASLLIFNTALGRWLRLAKALNSRRTRHRRKHIYPIDQAPPQTSMPRHQVV
jgi:hypothetical protein